MAHTRFAPSPIDGLPGPAVFLRGLGAGIAAAIVGGLLWYGVVIVVHRQFFYLALLLGFGVGAAVAWGSGRRANIATYATAVVLALVSILAATYFIDRYFLIRFLHHNGVNEPLRVWDSFDFSRRLMLDSTFGGTRLFRGALRIKGDPARIVFWVLALVGAALGVRAVADDSGANATTSGPPTVGRPAFPAPGEAPSRGSVGSTDG